MSHDPTTIPAWAELLAEPDPDDERLSELTARLAPLDGPADEEGDWPNALWSILVEYEVPRWSLPTDLGGDGCGRVALVQRYARVAEGSLTAAFVLSQHDAAVRRLAAASDRPAARGWLEQIAAGRAFATVGISHLTTSRRLGPQALRAVESGGGYRLDGTMPWVTGSVRADVFVTGAVLDDGRQFLVAVPKDREGLHVQPPFALAALQASCTSEVRCEGVEVSGSELMAGPSADVMSHPGAAGTGGLETSALALGQARAALVALEAESPQRTDLSEPVEALADSWRYTWDDLAAAASGRADAPTSGQVRGRANALVLRATQAYLTARKGTGFLRTEPAQRWARQALFFLVWSCPGPVAQATIRDLAGLCEA
jgi:alkylation response protein AidB-like acyl-CoA dehydrogenase